MVLDGPGGKPGSLTNRVHVKGTRGDGFPYHFHFTVSAKMRTRSVKGKLCLSRRRNVTGRSQGAQEHPLELVEDVLRASAELCSTAELEQ